MRFFLIVFLATKHRREKIYVAFPFDFLGYQTQSLIIFLFLFKFISKKSKEIVVVLMIRKRKKIQYPRERGRERERVSSEKDKSQMSAGVYFPTCYMGGLHSQWNTERRYILSKYPIITQNYQNKTELRVM